MSCPPSRNGNMPAGQVRPRCIRGEIILTRLGQITQAVDIRQTRDVGIYMPIHGAFSICMEMSGNGLRIGIGSYPAGNRCIDPIGPLRARSG